jgi:hypothetical protein
MFAFSERFGRVEVVLIERRGGGWLAVSAPGANLRIGVEGESQEQAEQNFVDALARWTAVADEPKETRVLP